MINLDQGVGPLVNSVGRTTVDIARHHQEANRFSLLVARPAQC